VSDNTQYGVDIDGPTCKQPSRKYINKNTSLNYILLYYTEVKKLVQCTIIIFTRHTVPKNTQRIILVKKELTKEAREKNCRFRKKGGRKVSVWKKMAIEICAKL